jgi:AcrR family transcriptional regulator
MWHTVGMVSNPQRRRRLLDAGIDVLARQGARGLTFRAVDEAAAVPPGTTSNYFTNRDEMLRELGGHVFDRLTPTETPEPGAPTRAREAQLMKELLGRARRDREGFLALYELRLEAARRPDLADAISDRYAENLEVISAGHVEGGFPGDRRTALLLYLAMSGLILEYLTLPGLLPPEDDDLDDLVADVVTAIVPAE